MKRAGAGKPKDAVALGDAGEDSDGKQVVADRELATDEDGAARDAVLVAATAALEQLAAGNEVVIEATAARAESGALNVGQRISLKVVQASSSERRATFARERERGALARRKC